MAGTMSASERILTVSAIRSVLPTSFGLLNGSPLIPNWARYTGIKPVSDGLKDRLENQHP